MKRHEDRGQEKEAVYLINDNKYLHLRKNGAGVGFATYKRMNGELLESGQVSEMNLPPDGRNALSAARNWYMFVLSDEPCKAIQQESVQILESILKLFSLTFGLSTATTMIFTASPMVVSSRSTFQITAALQHE